MIGGTGGSGTGLVMSIVQRAGRFMGADLSPFGDAMDLARFDWRWGLAYIRGRRSEPPDPPPQMVAEHDAAVQHHLSARPRAEQPWGWKHPHSYLLIPFLLERHPELRFVHVVRDGRDMAFSTNQQQARRYGPAVLGSRWIGPQPVRSAAYWSWANRLAADDGERALGRRYLRIRFEDLCSRPRDTVERLLDFVGATDDGPDLAARASEAIGRPASLGRWRRADRALANAIGEAAAPALRRFGYASS